MRHTWLPVEGSSFAMTLLSLLKSDPDYLAGAARVMVFTRDVAAAERVAGILADDGLQHVVYHKSVSQVWWRLGWRLWWCWW